MGIIRTIFAAIDTVIYSVVATILQAIVDLANIELFQQSVIREFANRIYIILGLVMLFKMIISFIQILIDPDKMDDKESGMANVLKRVVIALLLIVMVPSIFDLGRQLQNYILPIIPKVVLGVEADFNSSSGQTTLSSAGREMAFYTFLAFFNYDNVNCDDGSIRGTGSQLSTEGGSSVSPSINSVNDAAAHVNDSCNASTDSRSYRYQYRFVLSTIVGLYLIYVLVTIAVNVAVRTFKFAICEFIAPVPIASYIDPKTSKQSFDNWVKTSVDTYVSLFIQLAMVYFMIFVFEKVLANNFISGLFGKLGGDWWRTSMVILFIIAGLLTFVKSAPKFITDMLGIKGDGSLAGIFKGEGWKQSATALGGLAGTGASAVGLGIGNTRYALKNGESGGKAFMRGVGGFFGATRRGLTSTFKGEGWKGAYTSNIQKTSGISHRRSDAASLATLSRKEYDAAMQKLDNKITEARNNNNLTDEEREQKIREYEQLKTLVPKPIMPIRDSVRKSFATFQGLQAPTGSSYSSASSTLSGTRGELYTGEAMKKLDEEGSKLDGVFHKYKFTDVGGTQRTDIGFNYTSMKTAFDQVANGASQAIITDKDGNQYSLKAADVREFYKTAQKKGAIDYVNVSQGMDITDDFGVDHRSGVDIKIENTAMDEGIKQLRGNIAGMNIPSDTKATLLSMLDRNPGEALKLYSDISKEMQTSGARRSSYEQTQEKK